MKKFRTNYTIKKDISLLLIVFFLIINMIIFGKIINSKILNISKSMLDNLTVLYVKKNILPDFIDINKLIIVNLNNDNEISYMDINTDYSYELMKSVVGKIQNNINMLENGKFENKGELFGKNGNVYIQIPIIYKNNMMFLTNIGPKICIKLSFFENAIGDLNVTAESFGINNSIIKIYLNVTIEQKVNIPFAEQKYLKTYDVLLASKIISGTVPDIYGGAITKTTEMKLKN